MPRKPRDNSIAAVRQSAQRAEYRARQAKASAEERAWRQFSASYKGGVPTRTSEAWQRAEGFRFETTQERQQVTDTRGRAYQAYDNNLVAQTLVNTETDNVIGDGLNFQPTTSSPEWNREAKDRYYQWLDQCSVRGGDVHSGCELQRMLWARSRVAGDIGWILIARGSDSFVQVVSPENIVTPDGMHADKAVFDGIRFDAQGKPATFYVMYTDERGPLRRFEPIPARDFVWLPHMTKPNQARPPSCFVTIFDLMAHLDRYVDGVSLAAHMATVFGLIFKESNSAKQVNQLPLLPNSQGVQQRAVTLENGMVKYIGTDGEVAQVQAQQPMQQTPEFIRTMYRMLGQPFDMPLEVLAKDMSTCNFASARIGLLPFYRSCRIKAGRFASRWSRTIRFWLSREALRAPGDPKKWKTPFPADFWNHELLVNAWDYTDPVSEAQADQLQIDMGTKSHQLVISERGRDAEQLVRDRQEWAAKAAGLPEVRSTMTRDPVPEPVAAEKPDEDKAFSRDLTKAFVSAAGPRAILANNTDLRQLLADAGAPVRAKVAAEEGVPLLPVVGDSGPLVDGSEISGPDGLLVGGDVEKPDPAELPGEEAGEESGGEGADEGESGEPDDLGPDGNGGETPNEEETDAE